MSTKSKYIKKKIKNYYGKKYWNKKKENYKKNLYDNHNKTKEVDNYYNKKNQTEILVQTYHKKRQDDTIFRIIDNMSKRINIILKKNKIKKKFTYNQLFGCNPSFLKKYLKKKFINNMSYENYSDWEVDHIIPISSFDLSKEGEIQKCFHYTNLQPLWKEDNLYKSNKLTEQPDQNYLSFN